LARAETRLKFLTVLFSVIVPTYNRAQLLPRTLGSVFAQTFRDHEIVVVDDGSTDGTREYLESLDDRVSVLYRSNGGPGAARNSGASRASGEYLAFLDSDDLWFPWTLSSFAELIRRYDRPSVLSGSLVEFREETELRDVNGGEVKADAFPDYLASFRKRYFVGSGMSVLRREEFSNSGGYRDHLQSFEDHDVILRMGEARGFVQVLEPVTVAYRKHSANLTQVSRRSYEGACYLVEQERSGSYPGGDARARARRAIITQRTRPLTFDLVRDGLFRDAWGLYGATLAWNLELGRVKYLGGLPFKTAFAWLATTLG
jgi:glycosyltransferase involved in cell wall biosynthesis